MGNVGAASPPLTSTAPSSTTCGCSQAIAAAIADLREQLRAEFKAEVQDVLDGAFAVDTVHEKMERYHALIAPYVAGGESEEAKAPLCTTWSHGFARSRRDLTICMAKGGACSSRFLFRKAAS